MSRSGRAKQLVALVLNTAKEENETNKENQPDERQQVTITCLIYLTAYYVFTFSCVYR